MGIGENDMVWYSLVYYFVVVCLICTAVKAFSHKTKTGNELATVQLVAAGVILLHTLTFWFDSLRMVTIISSFFLIALDFLYIVTLRAIIDVVLGKRESKWCVFLFGGLYSAVVVDIIIFIVNLFHRISVSYVPIRKMGGRIVYNRVISPPFYLHLFICYFCAALAVLFLIVKIAGMPKLYRSRYSSMLWTFLIMVVLDYMLKTGYISVRYGNIMTLAYCC